MALRRWWLEKRKLRQVRNRALGNRRTPRGAPGPLWTASENGDVKTVIRLLGEGQKTEQTYKGWTPLMKAAEEGHCECLKALLEARARVDASNSKGRRALSFAAVPSMGRQAVIPALEIMLRADADLQHRDFRGETARARALRGRFGESVTTIDRFVAEQASQPTNHRRCGE